MPGVLFLAFKYAKDPAQALAVNAELSGDNCHRGSLLGALLGAASGTEFLAVDFEQRLHRSDVVSAELDNFADLCAVAEIKGRLEKAPEASSLKDFFTDAHDTITAGFTSQSTQCSTGG